LCVLTWYDGGDDSCGGRRTDLTLTVVTALDVLVFWCGEERTVIGGIGDSSGIDGD
jgi:hypothetical protein